MSVGSITRTSIHYELLAYSFIILAVIVQVRDRFPSHPYDRDVVNILGHFGRGRRGGGGGGGGQRQSIIINQPNQIDASSQSPVPGCIR